MESCIHHWIIDQEFRGTCKKCGTTNDFSTETTKPFNPNWGQKLDQRHRLFWGGGYHHHIGSGWSGAWDNAVKIYEANHR